MPKWERTEDMPAELRAKLEKVRKFKEDSDRARRPYLDRWNDYYGLYRNYRRLKAARPGADELEDAKREWGAELFIPYTFATIETLVPRVLDRDPRMVVKPLSEQARNGTQPISRLFEQRQNEIDYALKLQPVARRGLKYGLGVGKTHWERDARQVKKLERRIYGSGFTEREREVVRSEGPQFEDVDLFDFFWDPAAKSIETCEAAMHRAYRSRAYVAKMLKSGTWDRRIDPKVVEQLTAETNPGEAHRERLVEAGLSDPDTRQGQMHEVWEYHDGEEVITVLDGALVVLARPSFFHRELPFQIFRPTLQEGEFPGIGEIEPIAHLQYELNTLRSQRRDNATLVLQKAFLYMEGRVDPEDLVIAPGGGIAVQGMPRDTIVPLEIGEIPASGYSEEEALKRDIERTVGVSDTVAGGESGAGVNETATGVQLIQSAANIRIKQKVKNLEAETITPAARQWLELYRQYTFGKRTVRIEDQSAPGGYAFPTVGPEELAADVEVLPESGSTEPENEAQKRNDAMTLYNQASGNGEVDQRKLAAWLFGQFGWANPEEMLVPPQPKIDPNVMGQILTEQVGMPEEAALQAVQVALAGSNGEEQPQEEAA